MLLPSHAYQACASLLSQTRIFVVLAGRPGTAPGTLVLETNVILIHQRPKLGGMQRDRTAHDTVPRCSAPLAVAIPYFGGPDRT